MESEEGGARATVAFTPGYIEEHGFEAWPEQGCSSVDNPAHYTAGKVETIDKIEAVVEGLPASQAVLLANVIKYVDRAGLKGDAGEDLAKANNYAHRLVFGDWRSA